MTSGLRWVYGGMLLVLLIPVPNLRQHPYLWHTVDVVVAALIGFTLGRP